MISRRPSSRSAPRSARRSLPLVALAALTWLAPARAEAVDPVADDDDEATTAPRGDGDDAEEAPARDARGEKGEAAAAATNEETIFVVQAKPHLVAGRFEIAPQIVQSIGDKFVSHTGVLISGIYHLKENVALEIAGGTFAWWDPFGAQPNPRLGGHLADMTLELRKESLSPTEHADVYTYTWLAATDLQFSPLYGKVSFHDVALGQFNLYLSVGLGLVGLQLDSTLKADTLVDLPQPAMAPTATFGGGVRFYFSEWLGVRIELRDYVAPLSVYAEKNPNGVKGDALSSFNVQNLFLAQLGVSFLF